MKRFPLVFAACAAAVVGSAFGFGSTPHVAQAAPNKGALPKPAPKTPAKPAAKSAKSTKSKARNTPAAPLPQYVSLATIKKLQAARKFEPQPILQPFLDGQNLKGKDMMDLVSNPPVIVVKAKVGEVEAGGAADVGNGDANTDAAIVPETQVGELSQLDEILPKTKASAQAFPPGGVRPAAIRRTPLPVQSPRWVRYPLEFQLCGIALGTKAVDKDKFNRIDRYGLFAIHGNPTAVVTSDNVTVSQQPPEVAGLFPNDPGGGLPDWAGAVTVPLDENHVQWLYRRDTYAMGFVGDKLGYVDAIVVAGVSSPIARLQLEDPVHTIKLGADDMRKVLYRYGYPDDIKTFEVNAAASAGGDGQVNNPYRLFEFRYEQSYNVVFTIRNNRVVRMYIFGDPDFFNAQRRKVLRNEY